MSKYKLKPEGKIYAKCPIDGDFKYLNEDAKLPDSEQIIDTDDKNGTVYGAKPSELADGTPIIIVPLELDGNETVGFVLKSDLVSLDN